MIYYGSGAVSLMFHALFHGLVDLSIWNYSAIRKCEMKQLVKKVVGYIYVAYRLEL